MTDARSTPGAKSGNASGPWFTRGGVGAGLMVVALFVVLGLTFASLSSVAKWVIELDSVVLLIAGFVTVTLVLYTGTIIMTVLGMRTKTEALGMPPGSIRALIAMVLILIFAIIGVVVLKQSIEAGIYTSTGVTQAQIDAIRAGGGTVLQQDRMPPAPGAPATSSEPLYTAQIRQAMTPEGHDFALQLLTTVSTLVVAVAGFYFGSKNLGSAAEIALAARAPERPAPELIPAVPDHSRDEDPGDTSPPPDHPPEPPPAGPGSGEPGASPDVPGNGTQDGGDGAQGEPSTPLPQAGADAAALPIETVKSLDGEEPQDGGKPE